MSAIRHEARRGRLDDLLPRSGQPDLCGSSDERLNACGYADWVAPRVFGLLS
jgi:hypothetical protein